MKKKIFIGVLISSFIFSIGLNILLLRSFPTLSWSDEDRTKEAYLTLDFYRYSNKLDSINSVLSNDTTKYSKEVIDIFDSTIYKLSIMKNELIGTSGGLNRNAGLINAHGVNYVNAYFYGNNYWRPGAADFFAETLNDYLDQTDALNITSDLKKSFLNYNEHNGTPIFDELTVVESILLLDIISRQIKEDKLGYVLRE